MRTHMNLAVVLVAALGGLIALTLRAYAGGYYAGGYYGHVYAPGYSRGWYSSSCCYRRGGRRYYSRPFGTYYYTRPYHAAYSAGPYDVGGGGCYAIRVRICDGRGGWVWGRQKLCY